MTSGNSLASQHSPDVADTVDADTLTYPISPEYVRSWTPVRALCELIANALDEDPAAQVAWADGVLSITDDGPGIPEEGMILGASSKTMQQIGQFGEGKKLACLVLARSPEIGAVRCETVGYRWTPSVERRRLLAGLIPSRSGEGAEVLVYHLSRNDRTRGTVFTVVCPQELAEEAIGRFRALTEPGYQPPQLPGTCVLTGEPGRVWIGGVLVSTVDGLLASYDLPLDVKGLQNRDRTVIEAGALRDAVRGILAAHEDPVIIELFAAHVLAGGSLREQELIFDAVTAARPRAAWRAWARATLPAKTYYAGRRQQEEAVLDLRDKNYTAVSASGIPALQEHALMALLGVELARARQQQHYERNRGKTTWVNEQDLTAQERGTLTDTTSLVRRAIGAFALDRVRVYSASEETPCASGFYTPTTGDVAIHRDTLADRQQTLSTLLHEAAHRVGHRGGGRWHPIHDYADRSRGFENLLSDFAGLLLGYLADGGTLPDVPEQPASPSGQAPQRRRVRLSGADDPAVPISRRDLAHLLLDRLPHALVGGGFTNAADLVASTAVDPRYWRLMTDPKTAGFRRTQGVSTAWDYDKVAVLAEAVGVHPPVMWLGTNLCEGPLYGIARRRWNEPGRRWARRIRDLVSTACTDLEALGGGYAEQVPALRALTEGRTPTPAGEDSWQAPVRALIALERQRLHLDDTETAA
ncbi:hypothetical protein ACFPIJ_56490 [Dactylosporangium cerinum]|uniref:ATP-binding protein n=1 Tax=Dactylosporangium cerinum TaxID=1434730 RepID=A0ABV9WHU6_9ACTN